jgi:hypothetical protein
MRVDTQLAVFLENKPGALASMCELLAENDVNLLALSVSDTVDHAVVRVVTDKPDEASHLLGNAGMLVVESPVLIMNVRNEPGTLGRVADQLAENDINIEYCYCTVTQEADTAALVLRIQNPERAVDVLTE